MSPDILIVNFRSAQLIGRTVAVAREFAGEEARLIVVDNSPGDGSSEIIRSASPGATVITNPVNRGFAAAVNQAFAVAEADVVFLLNPDVQRISGSYAEVADGFRDRRVAAVAARLINADGTEQPNCFRAPRPFDFLAEDMALAERFPNWRRSRRFRMPEWAGPNPRRIDWAAGACLFLRRAAFADVGPFDERFFVYCEETDWLRAGETAWLAYALPADGRGDACVGGQLARCSHAAVPPAAREPASLRTQALTDPLRPRSCGQRCSESTQRDSSGTGWAGATTNAPTRSTRIRIDLTMRAPRPS